MFCHRFNQPLEESWVIDWGCRENCNTPRWWINTIFVYFSGNENGAKSLGIGNYPSFGQTHSDLNVVLRLHACHPLTMHKRRVFVQLFVWHDAGPASCDRWCNIADADFLHNRLWKQINFRSQPGATMENIANWKDLPFSMGKSTINGPFP